MYKANVIYRGTSISNPEITYKGESKLNAEIRWKQHPTHDSAPSKHLKCTKMIRSLGKYSLPPSRETIKERSLKRFTSANITLS